MPFGVRASGMEQQICLPQFSRYTRFVDEVQERYLHLIRALKADDLEGVRFALENPPDWANGRDALLHIHVLAHAIGCAPLGLIKTLVEAGADPNYEAADGFPSLILALGAGRLDRHKIIALLLRAGADPNQRGNGDYTALHVAAGKNDLQAVELLLEHGADPYVRTRIDELETPLEVAKRAGAVTAATAILNSQQRRKGGGP